MMTDRELFERIVLWPKGEWWERAAAHAVFDHRFELIADRSGENAYMVRFWIAPQSLALGLNSSDSILLHYFLQPDDDSTLHDHPWDFTTTILAGGYVEALPPAGGQPSGLEGPDIATADRRIWRAGDTIHHKAEDLHAIVSIEPGTWTLVRTGPKRRSWGFHPPGRPWMHWPDYIKEFQTTNASVESPDDG